MSQRSGDGESRHPRNETRSDTSRRLPADDYATEPADLDKEQIEQLHAVTLQVSSNCFELKKLCATVLIAAGTLIVTLTSRKLDDALFVAGLVVVLLFWVADAQSYFIQAKLRNRMKELQENRVRRFQELQGYDTAGVGLPIVTHQSRRRRVLRSFFNASMLYYFLIAAVLSAAWLMYGTGVIS